MSSRIFRSLTFRNRITSGRKNLLDRKEPRLQCCMWGLEGVYVGAICRVGRVAQEYNKSIAGAALAGSAHITRI